MKGAARRSPNCVRKSEKIPSVERWYLSHYRNTVKNCLLTENVTEIGQSAADLWPKTIFKMVAVRHLQFLWVQ